MMCLNDYRRLAKILDTPPMFIDVLPLIVRPDETDILISLSERKTVKELSKELGMPVSVVESKVRSLYVRGFLEKKRDREVSYKVRSFRGIIDRYLSEGRSEPVAKYVAALAEYLMETHVEKARGNPYPASKVLPIPEAVFEPVSIVIPHENAISIIKSAESISAERL